MRRDSQRRSVRWHDYHPERAATAHDRGTGAVRQGMREMTMEVPESFESPESSTIAAAEYNRETQTLSVMFKRKGNTQDRYDYPNVPEELWGRFVAAESKGQFFGSYIRPVYDGTHIIRV